MVTFREFVYSFPLFFAAYGARLPFFLEGCWYSLGVKGVCYPLLEGRTLREQCTMQEGGGEVEDIPFFYSTMTPLPQKRFSVRNAGPPPPSPFPPSLLASASSSSSFSSSHYS